MADVGDRQPAGQDRQGRGDREGGRPGQARAAAGDGGGRGDVAVAGAGVAGDVVVELVDDVDRAVGVDIDAGREAEPGGRAGDRADREGVAGCGGGVGSDRLAERVGDQQVAGGVLGQPLRVVQPGGGPGDGAVPARRARRRLRARPTRVGRLPHRRLEPVRAVRHPGRGRPPGALGRLPLNSVPLNGICH